MIGFLREMSLKSISLKYSSGVFRPLDTLGSSRLEKLNLSHTDIKSGDIVENIKYFPSVRVLKVEDYDQCLRAISHLT